MSLLFVYMCIYVCVYTMCLGPVVRKIFFFNRRENVCVSPDVYTCIRIDV